LERGFKYVVLYCPPVEAPDVGFASPGHLPIIQQVQIDFIQFSGKSRTNSISDNSRSHLRSVSMTSTFIVIDR
jgi:hypothetical protein